MKDNIKIRLALQIKAEGRGTSQHIQLYIIFDNVSNSCIKYSKKATLFFAMNLFYFFNLKEKQSKISDVKKILLFCDTVFLKYFANDLGNI